MKKTILLWTATILAASSGQANVLLSDNFDSEAAGSVLNFTGFDNFDVEDGSVDYLKGYPGLACVSGGCVDLDGSTGDGGYLVTKLGYAFNAGDLVKFTFSVSGNQRGGNPDNVMFGFRSTGGAVQYNEATSWVNGSAGFVFDYLGQDYDTALLGASSSMPYTTYSLSFKAGNAGAVKAYVGTNSADSIGPILDNFSFEITPGAVPEPASWAMMIAGFAIAGATLRRRNGEVRFA